MAGQKMIKNKDILDRFYRKLIKQERFSYRQALTIYEALHKEAISLKRINSQNIMEGLETALKIARAVNGLAQCSKN